MANKIIKFNVVDENATHNSGDYLLKDKKLYLRDESNRRWTLQNLHDYQDKHCHDKPGYERFVKLIKLIIAGKNLCIIKGIDKKNSQKVSITKLNQTSEYLSFILLQRFYGDEHISSPHSRVFGETNMFRIAKELDLQAGEVVYLTEEV